MIRNPMQKLKRAREVKRGHDGVRMRSTTWQTRRKHQTGRRWQGKQEKPGGAFRLKSGAGNSSACQSTCHRDGSIVNRFYSHLHFGPLWEWDVLWCLSDFHFTSSAADGNLKELFYLKYLASNCRGCIITAISELKHFRLISYHPNSCWLPCVSLQYEMRVISRKSPKLKKIHICNSSCSSHVCLLFSSRVHWASAAESYIFTGGGSLNHLLSVI